MENGLLLFARYPEAGRVKTRLSPILGNEGASLLYRSFLIDLVTRLLTLHNVDLRIAVAGRPGDLARMDELLDQLVGPENNRRITLLRQEGDDLGNRMAHAFESAFRGRFRKVVILGADHPTVPLRYLEDAFTLLERSRGVLGPSVDGGFWTIGLSEPVPEVFQGMTWSTSTVFAEMFRRLRSRGVDVELLPEWYDVDRPDDLARLALEVEVADDLPATRRTLSELGVTSNQKTR